MCWLSLLEVSSAWPSDTFNLFISVDRPLMTVASLASCGGGNAFLKCFEVSTTCFLWEPIFVMTVGYRPQCVLMIHFQSFFFYPTVKDKGQHKHGALCHI